jgi:uncharacterized protein YegL
MNTRVEMATRKKGGNENKVRAGEFFESHRDIFELYAKGKIKIEPAPPGLDTFAFDLEKGVIYVNDKFYQSKFGLSDEKSAFAVRHEIEHLLEKVQVLKEPGGWQVFQNYLQDIKNDRAYGILDNCIADIRENRAVVSKTNKGVKDTETRLYREDLFPADESTGELDFTKQPKHLQFPQAILREERTDDKCIVDEEVRKKIDHLRNFSTRNGKIDLIKTITDPNVPMSKRLEIQNRIIRPMMEDLRKKDIEDKKKQKREQSSESSNGEKSDDGESGESPQSQSGSQEKEGIMDKIKKRFGKEKSKSKKSEKEQAGQTPDKGKGENFEETDYDQIFKKEYDEAEGKTMNAVPVEQQEKALEKWLENPDNRKTEEEKSLERQADHIGVNVEDLKNYENIVRDLDSILNPVTNESVIKDLSNLIKRIISKRVKPSFKPKYPVEEGDELIEPAELLASVRAGNLQPKVWQDTEVKEKKGDLFGKVKLSFVLDRSGSMSGQKLIELQRAIVMAMESQKELQDLAEEEKSNLIKTLEVFWEIWTFQNSNDDLKPFKKMSDSFTKKDRIETCAILNSAPGDSTPDFNCLESILKEIQNDASRMEELKQKESKEIIIVMTDGRSDSPQRVQKVIEELRNLGVVVVAIGITEGGRSVETTYGNNGNQDFAKVAGKASDLPIVLGDVLFDNLKDL